MFLVKAYRRLDALYIFSTASSPVTYKKKSEDDSFSLFHQDIACIECHIFQSNL